MNTKNYTGRNPNLALLNNNSNWGKVLKTLHIVLKSMPQICEYTQLSITIINTDLSRYDIIFVL